MKNFWKENLKEVLENHDGTFGHNTEVDIKRYLSKIEKLSSPRGRLDLCQCEIDIMDYYTVKITMPADYGDGSPYREDVLMYILTTPPMPTECRFNSKKDQLTIEWHY